MHSRGDAIDDDCCHYSASCALNAALRFFVRHETINSDPVFRDPDRYIRIVDRGSKLLRRKFRKDIVREYSGSRSGDHWRTGHGQNPATSGRSAEPRPGLAPVYPPRNGGSGACARPGLAPGREPVDPV